MQINYSEGTLQSKCANLYLFSKEISQATKHSQLLKSQWLSEVVRSHCFSLRLSKPDISMDMSGFDLDYCLYEDEDSDVRKVRVTILFVLLGQHETVWIQADIVNNSVK